MLTELPVISSVDCASWWSQRTPILLRPPIPMLHFGCSIAMDWRRKYITSRCVLIAYNCLCVVYWYDFFVPGLLISRDARQRPHRIRSWSTCHAPRLLGTFWAAQQTIPVMEHLNHRSSISMPMPIGQSCWDFPIQFWCKITNEDEEQDRKRRYLQRTICWQKLVPF